MKKTRKEHPVHMSVRRSDRSTVLWILCLLVSSNMLEVCAIYVSATQTLTPSVYAQNTVNEDGLFKRLIAQAGKAYRDHRFLDAIKHFEDAMLLRANPNIHWNLSVCYYKLKNPQKSLYHINLYIKLGNPTQEMKYKVEQRRIELLHELKRRLDGTERPVIVSPNSMPQGTSGLVDSPGIYQLKLSPKLSPSTTQVTRKRKAILWGIASIGSFAVSAGIHLYADSIWASRPSGGGTSAQNARQDALITSWTADGFLVLGLVAAVVSGVYYFNEHQGSAPAQLKACHTCIKDDKKRWGLRWGTPIFLLLSKRPPHILQQQATPKLLSQPRDQGQYTEAILGWRMSF